MSTSTPDTNILIDVSRGFEPTIELFEQITSTYEPTVSVVTYMELIVGCQNKRSLQSVESFLEDFKLVSIDPAIAEQALQMLKQYRLSHGLLIADALIAATAVSNNLPLLTRNVKDFRYIEGLSLASAV